MEIRTLLADPPWKFGDKLPGDSRGAEKNYSCLSVKEIESFLETDVFPNGYSLADDCRLFLWRVSSMQEEALSVIRKWGFVHKAEIVWIKKTENDKLWFGMGRQVRMSHEVCLIATRGRPETLNKSVRSIFEAKYTRHSGKPGEFYSIVESLSSGPYLELFARNVRPGWEQLGNQLPKE